MPTPRERANGVVSAWLDPSGWDSRSGGFALPTAQLERLATLIQGAIDAQVADWMASQPRPNGWHGVARASHVVASEEGKDYAGLLVVTDPATAPMTSSTETPPCRHETTRWNDHNTRLVCRSCGDEFKPGTCIRCGRPAVSRDSFSCGVACATR